MNIRGNRSVVAAIVGVVVVVVVAAALVLLRGQQHDDEVKDADRAATTFEKKLDAFTKSLTTTLKSGEAGDPAALKSSVDAQLASAPKLGGVSSYGREHSEAYARAQKDEKTLAPRLKSLSVALGEAVKGQTFVTAARAVLKLEPTDFITPGPMTNGRPIREKMIPGYTRALATFDKVEVPAGQEKLAKQVHGAVAFVIDGAQKLADKLDAHQSYAFTFEDKYAAARKAIDAYAGTLKQSLGAAVSTSSS